ncbi:MAG: hypothetical protein ACI4Q3_04525 [Kiritimatiellia bacterium]
MKKSFAILAVVCLPFFPSMLACGAAEAPVPAARPPATNAAPAAAQPDRTVRAHRGCRPKRSIRRGGLSVRHRHRPAAHANP